MGNHFAAYDRALQRSLKGRRDVWIWRRADEATLRTSFALPIAAWAFVVVAVVRYSEDETSRRAETVML